LGYVVAEEVRLVDEKRHEREAAGLEALGEQSVPKH
jgi:hypothetical protein